MGRDVNLFRVEAQVVRKGLIKHGEYLSMYCERLEDGLICLFRKNGKHWSFFVQGEPIFSVWLKPVLIKGIFLCVVLETALKATSLKDLIFW
jgi:hypothetical protein